jgi:CRISPR system Cascade subunit CasA
MPFNLITDAWLPVRLRDGTRSVIRPAQIVEHLTADGEVIAPDWPRPDLNVATYELLIGLLQVAFAPKDTKDWHRLLEQPPDIARLDEAFLPLIPWFNLDGDGPRFMQDFDELEGEPGNIEALFIDATGENAIKKNADLMVKRQRYNHLSRATAAITLYALQQFAPSGGAGHRTSMRGGGPMTTLVLPPSGENSSLWQLVWHNVMTAKQFDPVDPGDLQQAQRIFPWLAPAITSKKGREVHQGDPQTHPLQSYFGMPRRIRLVFEENSLQQACDLTGTVDDSLATGYITRPYGVNYGQWRHPLTPYYRKKAEDMESFATHPTPGRFGYQNWLAIVLGNEAKTRDPAKTISVFQQERQKRLGGDKPRLLIAGWAMSNMKPLDFILAEQPLHVAADETHQKNLDRLARRMVLAADKASGILIGAVQDALKAGGNKPKQDSSLINALRESFFADTETGFHKLLHEFASQPDVNPQEIAASWLKNLQRTAFALFDATVQPDPSDPLRAEQAVRARQKLAAGLFYGKGDKSLRGILALPVPAKKGPTA